MTTFMMVMNITDQGMRVAFLKASDPDAMPKFALALGSLGNVHTKTVRAWSEAEFLKIVSELP